MAQRTLTLRERALILGAAIVFVSIIVVPIARGFARDYREVKMELRNAGTRLEQARSLREAVLAERAAQRIIAQRVSAQGRQFNLYDYTNATLTRLDLRDRMRLEKRLGTERIDSVDVTLTNVSLKEFVDFLHALNESGQLVALRSLSYLRPAQGNKGLDCSMTLTAPRV